MVAMELGLTLAEWDALDSDERLIWQLFWFERARREQESYEAAKKPGRTEKEE